MTPAFALLCLFLAVALSTSFSFTLPPTSFVPRNSSPRPPLSLSLSPSPSSTVLERPAPLYSPPSPTASSARTSSIKKSNRKNRISGWELLIHNDARNTREHVARSLVLVTSTSEAAAYNIMMGAHKNGVASVGVYVREVGEVYVEGLGERGVEATLRPVEE
eukprot:CAMPEP_0182454388 /NCGR_PEP_ID=MMETSP1319-20130603/1050_1 /TAXON_ID=172717 /ORGANISM="Bolidomonas pacifica, Strain RCC208" /LENGTH=161 /DNA_ID=CAMNT_0024652401 /DNA_START=214 /DNA_END=699 /DNA_ORIENTATION=+